MDYRIKVAVAATVIGSIIVGASYTHMVREDARVAGLMFGNSLLDIQDALRAAQDALALRTRAWESGEMSDGALLEYYDTHLTRMNEIISRYDSLEAPPNFDAAVRLFELSAKSQQASDAEFALWVRDADASAKSRSDVLLQDAFEYESEALSAFNDARSGRVARTLP